MLLLPIKNLVAGTNPSDQRERASIFRAVARIVWRHCRPRIVWRHCRPRVVWRHCRPRLVWQHCCLLAFSVVALAVQSLPAAPLDDSGLAARREILDSPRWAAAKAKFDQWLSVQTMYTEDQMRELESALRNRIASMSGEELAAFLKEMEAKLTVLMSPASQDARRWASKFTPLGLRKRTEKYGVDDPIRMPAAELAEALDEFTADRQAARTTSAAFKQSRAKQMAAAQSYHRDRAKVAYHRKEAATFQGGSSSYAPRQGGSGVKVYPKTSIGFGFGWGW